MTRTQRFKKSDQPNQPGIKFGHSLNRLVDEFSHSKADEIEFWLDAAGHAPVGPEASEMDG